MPLVPESRPRHHPLSPGHLQVSPPDTVHPEHWPRAAGTPHSPPVSLRRLALTASGTRAPSPERDCATGGPCGKERAPGTHLTSHRSRRPPAGRARTRAPPPGAEPCRGARAWGAAAYGEPCVPGSPGLLRCDTRSCWEAQGAARSRAGLRRAGRAPPAPSWRGEVLRREPRRPPAGRGEAGGTSRAARRPPCPAALVPWARAGARPSPAGPRGWGSSGGGDAARHQRLPRVALAPGCKKSCEHSLEEGELGDLPERVSPRKTAGGWGEGTGYALCGVPQTGGGSPDWRAAR